MAWENPYIREVYKWRKIWIVLGLLATVTGTWLIESSRLTHLGFTMIGIYIGIGHAQLHEKRQRKSMVNQND